MKKSLQNQLFPILVLLVGTIWIEYFLIHVYPQQQFQTYLRSTQAIEKDPQERSDFQHSNARKYLQQLTHFGARITGSTITEKDIPNWIIQSVKEIQANHPNNEMKIEIDTQRPSSHFGLNFLGGMHNVSVPSLSLTDII